MASGKIMSRKRKLPADLAEAESLVRTANVANKTVTDGHKRLSDVVPQLDLM